MCPSEIDVGMIQAGLVCVDMDGEELKGLNC